MTFNNDQMEAKQKRNNAKVRNLCLCPSCLWVVLFKENGCFSKDGHLGRSREVELFP